MLPAAGWTRAGWLTRAGGTAYATSDTALIKHRSACNGSGRGGGGRKFPFHREHLPGPLRGPPPRERQQLEEGSVSSLPPAELALTPGEPGPGPGPGRPGPGRPGPRCREPGGAYLPLAAREKPRPRPRPRVPPPPSQWEASVELAAVADWLGRCGAARLLRGEAVAAERHGGRGAGSGAGRAGAAAAVGPGVAALLGALPGGRPGPVSGEKGEGWESGTRPGPVLRPLRPPLPVGSPWCW